MTVVSLAAVNRQSPGAGGKGPSSRSALPGRRARNPPVGSFSAQATLATGTGGYWLGVAPLFFPATAR